MLADFQSIADWLRTTILGIILLGALGSILGVFLLRFFKWAGFRLFVIPFLFSILKIWYRFERRLIVEWTLRRSLWGADEKEAVILLSVFSASMMLIAFMFWIGAVGGLVAYFTMVGIRATPLSVSLMVVAFLSAYSFVAHLVFLCVPVARLAPRYQEMKAKVSRLSSSELHSALEQLKNEEGFSRQHHTSYR
jgi:hypothetical protein